jgi:hypothetical protein
MLAQELFVQGISALVGWKGLRPFKPEELKLTAFIVFFQIQPVDRATS